MDEQLQNKLRVLLSVSRECLSLEEKTEVLSSPLYDDFWESLKDIEGTLTSLKSVCEI